MRKTQKRELDLLRQEKDQLLAEETKATQAGEYLLNIVRITSTMTVSLQCTSVAM